MLAIAAPSTPLPGLADAVRACRLLVAMPGFLRRPLREAEAVAVLRRRLHARPAAFLDTIRRALHGHPASPYPRLLAMAGCEYGDVARLVERDGVEATLTALARAGVYLTVDELKGRRPVLRGSVGFEVDPAGLASPDVPSHLVYRTSGSRGAGPAVSLDLGYYRERAVNLALCLAARGGRAWRHAMWLVPGGAASIVLLPYAALGCSLSAWFSPVESGSTSVDWRYRWSERLLRWGGRLGGMSFPGPVHVPLTQPLAVARWMRACLDAGQVPHLLAFPSAAAGLCRAAVAAGIDLAGARLSLGGEPVTAARMAEVGAAGALALPHYGSMETGFIGEGCLAPEEAVDEIHLFDDLHAVVQAGPDATVPPRALLVSSLGPAAPLVLLNVSLGDEAVLSRRRCGCPLEATGWTTHLHTIRSHEKLTAGGMTILDADAVTALEEVLPARFGGTATDYQLLEREDARGRPRLVLVVSPRVGAVDEAAVAAAFLGAIGADSGASDRLAALARGGRAPGRAPAAGRRPHREGSPPARGSPWRAPGAMTAHAALRARLRDWPKHPGCRPEPRAPLVTPGFPGTFNLSFTEHHWLREYGGYLDWPHDYTFTTIQSCARLGDLEPGQPEAGAQHLGVFEMADLCGAIALRARPDHAALQVWHVGELVRFLGELGIPPVRVHPSYSAGGPLAALTVGRYHFDAQIPPDRLSRDAFLLAGVPAGNVVCDRTRATLLSLHVHRPTPWGYRNEVHVDIGTAGRPRLIDVATVEYLLWRPRFAGAGRRRDDIVGLEPLDGGASIVAFGVERLAMATDRLERIHDIDSLRPFYDDLAAALGRRLGPADYRAGECLRMLHRIHADLAFHLEADVARGEDGTQRPSPRRREKLARLRRQVPLRLGEPALERLLLIHARSQPWHEWLEAAIEPTFRALATYRASRARDLIPE